MRQNLIEFVQVLASGLRCGFPAFRIIALPHARMTPCANMMHAFYVGFNVFAGVAVLTVSQFLFLGVLQNGKTVHMKSNFCINFIHQFSV